MKIVVFSGAGVSRESGLKTFRDSEDGLWENFDVNEVSSIKGWWKDPEKVLAFFNVRRAEVRRAQPNDAHRALADLEKAHDVTIITQNIDDLHERAGSTNVIHLHGEVLRARPVDDEETSIPWTGDLHLGDLDPKTKAQLRPFVVWFGEGLPKLQEAMDLALADDVEVLIVVGTTLNVYPAAMLATDTKAKQVFVIDPDPPALAVPNLKVVREPATKGVRLVVDMLMQ